MPQIPRRRRILYAFVATLAFLGLAEGVARLAELWRPPLPVDYGLGFGEDSRLFVADPEDEAFRITRPDKLAFFRPVRFAARKPRGTLRIAAVGGSSVYFLEDELEELAGRLRVRFDPGFHEVEILDVGGMSYGSHRLVGIVAELLAYDPDLLLLYTGNNEFEEVLQLELASRGAPQLQAALAHSALVRALRDGITAVRVAFLARDHNRRVPAELPPRARAWSHEFTPVEIAERMERFGTNLGSMVALARERDVEVVIGTVPSNLVRPVLGKSGWREFAAVIRLYNEGRHAEGLERARRLLREMPGRHQASDAENEIIRGVARAWELPLADVERAVEQAEPHGVPGETLFRDHCHLNRAGRAVWLETFWPAVEGAVARIAAGRGE